MDRGTFARLRPLAKDVRLQITNQWAEQRWTQLLSEDRIKAVPWIHLVKVVGEVDFCLFVVGDFEVEVTLDGFTVGTLATCCCSFRWCQMKCLFKVWSQHIFTDVGLPYMWEHGAFILCKCSSIFIPIFFSPFDSWRPKNIVLKFRSQRLMLSDWKIYPKAVEGHWLLYFTLCRYIVSTNNG